MWNVVSVIIAFALDFYVYEFYFKRYTRYMEFKGRILTLISKHSQCLALPYKSYDSNYQEKIDFYIKAKEDFSNLSDELMGFSEHIPKLNFTLPNRKAVFNAARELKNISEIIYEDKNPIHYQVMNSINNSLAIIAKNMKLETGEIYVGEKEKQK